MPGLEIYENFKSATPNVALGTSFNDWMIDRGNELAVVVDGSDYVLAGKGAGAGSKRLMKQLISPGQQGRIEAKVKITDGDLNQTNNLLNIGFSTVGSFSSIGTSKRSVILSFVNATNGYKFWNGTGISGLLLDVVAEHLNRWLTVGITTDGTGRYTTYVLDEANAIIAIASFYLPADAGKSLWAYVDFGQNQKSQDANGWGTQYYIKDIAARNDFWRYNEVSQRRHLRFECSFMDNDKAYVTISKDWYPPENADRVVISGHGHGATISFSTQLTAANQLPDNGFIYGISNTHGNTWGNPQANQDMEDLRKWIVDNCQANPKVYLYGSSMGGLNAINYAVRYPYNVKKIVTEISVISLQIIYRSNVTFSTTMNAAYNVTRYEEIPKRFDPIRNPDRLIGIPMMMWVGTSDTTTPHGQHTRPFVDKLSQAGGSVMYIEEPGETHTLDVDGSVYADFYNAAWEGSGLIESQTLLVRLEGNSEYNVTTKYPNMVAYILDSNQGQYTQIATQEERIKTKYRPMTILLKITDQRYSIRDIEVIKVS